MSSSPGLPSPSQLLSSKTNEVTYANRSKYIDCDMSAGFSSASMLLRNERFDGEAPPSAQRLGLGNKWQQETARLGSPISVQKSIPAQAAGANAREKPVFKDPRDREPVSTTSTPYNERDSPTEVPPLVTSASRVASAKPDSQNVNSDILPPKKTRKKKVGGHHQTKLKQAKVVKAVTSIQKTNKFGNKKAKAKDDPESLLAEAVAKKKIEMEKEVSPAIPCEAALRRRSKWTPVKDTCEDIVSRNSRAMAEDGDNLAIPCGQPSDSPKVGFGDLLGGFGCDHIHITQHPRSGIEPASSIEPEFAMQKRRIELVTKLPNVPSIPKFQKRDSLKKKPRTLTEKATEEYVDVDADSALTEYLMLPPSKQTTNISRPVGRKSNSLKKRISVLQSPETAMKVTSEQDVVFGTSSQLVREESPTFIREIQQATMESERCLPAITTTNSTKSVPDLSSGSSVTRWMPSRSLWSVAARDTDGSLMKAEVIDLVNTSKPVKSSDNKSELVANPNSSIKPSTASYNDRGRPTVEPSLPIEDVAILRQQTDSEPVEEDLRLPRSVAERGLKVRPKSRSPSKKAVVEHKKSSLVASESTVPKYNEYMDHELKSEIMKRGLKAIKTRRAMINLLERCWRSEHDRASGILAPEILLPTEGPAVADHAKTQNNSAKKRGRPPKVADGGLTEASPSVPPKRPRGRPKKDSTAAATTPTKQQPKNAKRSVKCQASSIHVDEIYDSDPPTPSPPRRRTPVKPTAALPLSPSSGQAMTAGSPVARKKDPQYRMHMLGKIGEAVVAVPRSEDKKNPTWREKMLLYDPIVIEDLAFWLNTQGLSQVGEDDEVDTGLVKAWCESKSICCLWRESLRGGKRARY